MQKLFTLLVYALLTLLYSQSMSAQTLVCSQVLNVSLDNTGEAILHKSIFLEGNYNFLITSIDIQDGSGQSLPGYVNGDNAEFSCADLGRIFTYVITDTTNNNQCWGYVKIEDKTAPTPYLFNLATVVLDTATCSAEAYAKDFDLGSIDNCNDLYFSFGQNPHIPQSITQNGQVVDLSVEHYYATPGTILSSVAAAPPTLHADYLNGGLFKWVPAQRSAARYFTGFDQGQHDISVFDESYNSQYASITVELAGCGIVNSPLCKPSVTIAMGPWGGDTEINPRNVIDYLPANHDAVISKDGIQYGNSLLLTCDDVGPAIDIYARYTDSNGDTVNCTVPTTYVDDAPPVMIADYTYFVELADSLDVITLQPSDVDNGSYDNCSLVSLTLSETEFDVSDIGQNLIQLTGTDASGNTNTVYSTIIVSVGPCTPANIVVTYPDTILRIIDPTALPENMTEQNLVSTYGFTEQQVSPTLGFSCNVLATVYDDVVFNIDVNGVQYWKVLREFTVIDWVTLWSETFTQEITNVPQTGDYICDILPRSAAISDCAGGHTLMDDVEWPDDIATSDYRLEPSNLVIFSGIDSLDAWPTLYNKASEYTMSYEDILVSLSPDTLVLNRRWTVVHPSTNQLWTYLQGVEVIVGNFNRLVAITDVVGRAMSDVIVNGIASTDNTGKVLVEEYTSATYDAGQIEYTVRDLITIARHILGSEAITDPTLLLAADVNEDNRITEEDLVLLREIMIGNEPPLDYQFIERSDNAGVLLEPQAIVIGYRPGDADGTGIVPDALGGTTALKVDDLLLNAGQTYQIEVYKAEDQTIRGLEAVMTLDPSMIEILSVESAVQGTTNWKLRNDNELRILADGPVGNLVVSGEPLYTITVKADANTVLSDVFAAPHSFKLVDDNMDILSTEELEIEDVITVGTNETEKTSISIYPNPTTDWLTIEAVGDIKQATLYNPLGQQVIRTDQQVVDVTSLSTGIYTIIVETTQGIGHERVSIIR